MSRGLLNGPNELVGRCIAQDSNGTGDHSLSLKPLIRGGEVRDDVKYISAHLLIYHRISNESASSDEYGHKFVTRSRSTRYLSISKPNTN